MSEGPPKLYNGIPLRRIDLGNGSYFFVIDSRDLAIVAHRRHQHALAAARAALSAGGDASAHISSRRYRARTGRLEPRFLLTERGVDLALGHMKNRLGLDKAKLIPLLRVAFDRAQHGFVDPPQALPAPDAEIRPPEVETALDPEPAAAAPPPPPPPPAPDPIPSRAEVVRDFIARRVAEEAAGPRLDLALNQRINSAIAALCMPAVKLPGPIVSSLQAWNAERLEVAYGDLRCWDDLKGLYAS